MDDRMVDYYRRRAPEYEAIYHKPERQHDLAALEGYLKKTFSDLDVLEIACGTGYWTQRIAEMARSISASDISEEVLAIATAKSYCCPVRFHIEDIYRPDHSAAALHDALFGGFIWSHIPRQQLTVVIETLAARICAGGLLVFADNRYVEGSSTPVRAHDAEGNTWQQRHLDDGSEYLVLKNFPDKSELQTLLSAFGELEVQELTYFWMVKCRLFSNKMRH
ncbi:MAG: class I SAM-dependent methyltransferase [Saprospiraceae bacterium]|nr:class I SAM-dependent methyltransferase [Saprospiraceae bacterium]